MQNMTRLSGFAVAALAVLLSACSKPAPPPPAPKVMAHDGWPDFATAFVESYFRADPFFAAQAGRHEFDGQMPDWSSAGIAAEVGRLKALRAEAEAFDPVTLSAPERFERDLTLHVIGGRLYWLDRARSPFTNPTWYLGQLGPEVYLSREYAPLQQRLAAYLGYLRAIPKVTADIRANLSAPLPPVFVARAVAGFGGYADFYRKDAPQVFAAVADPAAQKDLAAATQAAAAAMDALTAWIRQRGREGANYALGAGLFQEMLQATEQVDVPVEHLLAIGRADLERNTQTLRQACAQYLPGGSLAQCTAKMRSDKPQGGAVEAARTQLTSLRAFIVAKQIVDIPGDDVPQVAEAPPYNRANFAYIDVPGPYDKGVAYVFNIAPPDPAWSAREREEYIPGKARLLFTSVHEVWPGHFLQFLHSNRNPSRIAALWVGYAYAEGWAHYCEEMMWEEGLGDGDPATHIGQLTDALLRDVRFLSAIGLHTGGMSLAESERLFRDSAYQDAGNARQQAARGAYDPQYLKYTLGKLMIRKLRADWVAQQPASAGADPRQLWHAFHEKFLSYGGPPIPMVRRAMVGEAGSLF
jgi:uncharacterized protein (DUF885 family)